VYDTYVAIKKNTATYVFTHGSVIALTVMGFHFNQTPAALLGLVGRIRSVVSWKASTRGGAAEAGFGNAQCLRVLTRSGPGGAIRPHRRVVRMLATNEIDLAIMGR
jgi:hypothetical protein